MLEINGYKEELIEYVHDNYDLFRQFSGQKLMISGAAGLIGSYIVDLLIIANELLHLDIEVFALDRDRELLEHRFPAKCSKFVKIVTCDVGCEIPNVGDVDYVIHAASNTSPYDYATKPVDTILTNVLGTKVMCEYAISHRATRFLFCSSVEAYGRNNGDIDAFTEDYSGFVDSNTVRSNYPTAKRCSESLCNAYAAENAFFDFVIARIGRFYGPTVLTTDNKAPTQFLRNAVRAEDIVIKSDGTQLFSWGYVGDCATALLTLLKMGAKGEAYNIADPGSCKELGYFATLAATEANTSLVYVQQSQVEQQGYSKIVKATMDVTKLLALGWRAKHSLESGIPRTIRYLRSIIGN